MPDQLLRIQDEQLRAIARAIKTKGGTSADLEFPNGFVSALQAITTEVTVTPKITAQQKTLTPSETSFSIIPGFHDGTGTVKIKTQSKSVAPSSTAQTVYPDAGYFLSSVRVGGIGNGVQVATGTFTVNSKEFTISGFGDFTPRGIAGFIVNHSDVSKDRTVVFQGILVDGSQYYAGEVMWGNKATIRGGKAATAGRFTYANGSINVDFDTNDNKFIGTYSYIVWGS